MAPQPEFLFQVDVWIQAFSLVVALFISAFSLSAYMITKQKRQQIFSLAFLLIAVGILLQAVLNSWVQFEDLTIPLRGYLAISYSHAAMLLVSMAFILCGYVTIVVLLEKVKQSKVMFLLFLLAPLVALIAHEYYGAFHLFSLLLIGISLGHFLDNYRQTRSGGSLLVLLAFCALFVANAIILFAVTSYVFYILGTIVQLIGFLLFLIALIMIFLST